MRGQSFAFVLPRITQTRASSAAGSLGCFWARSRKRAANLPAGDTARGRLFACLQVPEGGAAALCRPAAPTSPASPSPSRAHRQNLSGLGQLDAALTRAPERGTEPRLDPR